MLSPNELALELRRVSRILWVRVAILATLSILAALAAPLVDQLLPETSKDRFTADATLPVLNILASGMLVVATFSLGVMVSSHRMLAANTTPRIHRLLMEDTSTQSMLATFIGAFVFSLVSIILFRAGYYSDDAAVAVFAATIIVVAAIVVSLVRWIHKLSRIGSVDYALGRAEDTAKETLQAHRRSPTLGATDIEDADRQSADLPSVPAPNSGFLAFLDVPKLQDCAEEADARVFVRVRPGDRVLKGQPIADIDGDIDAKDVQGAFSISAARSYEQDPRYALQALRETAGKALSPGINDPGTAVEVVTRLEILLHDYFCAEHDEDEERADRVFLRPISPCDLIDVAFRSIARDGAGFVDVLTAISVALDTMRRHLGDKDADCIRALADELEEHADKGLSTEAEKKRLTVLRRP